MENTTVETPGAVAIEPPSTVLNPETVKTTSGGGKTPISNETNSIQSVLEGELTRLRGEDANVEAEAKDKAAKAAEDAKANVDDKEKAEKDAKPEPDKQGKSRGDDGKFAKAEKADTDPQDAKAEQGAAPKPAAGQEGNERRQSEGPHREPPARFLPEARTKWANVPNEVKSEFHRVSQEYEAELSKAKQSTERYEQLRSYDDIARSNGRDLKDSLAKVVEIENALQRNPIAGLEAILREVGPRKADGSHVTLAEVAQYVMQNPQAAQSHAAPQPQTSAPENTRIHALEQQLLSMRMEQTVLPVINQFQESHPDFDTLSPQIEEILKTGVIEKIYGTGLSLEQKLTEAYRMAGGNAPPSRPDPEAKPDHSAAEPVPSKDAGTKSVRGAPSDGADTTVDEPETDLREMLRKEFRKIA